MPARGADGDGSSAATAKTRFLLKAHWMAPGHLAVAAPVESFEGEDQAGIAAARMQAWARFHEVGAQAPLEAVGGSFTVDLLEESLRRVVTEKGSYWSKDGESKIVGHGPGGFDDRVPMPKGLRDQIRSLGATKRLDRQVVPEVCTACGFSARDLCYGANDGLAYCAGHRPEGES